MAGHDPGGLSAEGRDISSKLHGEPASGSYPCDQAGMSVQSVSQTPHG
jgi:hypothetical protein